MGPVVVHKDDREVELSRQGRIRYYLNHQIHKDTPLQQWLVFSHELRTKSGKHRHQGGLVIYVIEGRGYSMVDGERWEWEDGDLHAAAAAARRRGAPALQPRPREAVDLDRVHQHADQRASRPRDDANARFTGVPRLGRLQAPVVVALGHRRQSVGDLRPVLGVVVAREHVAVGRPGEQREAARDRRRRSSPRCSAADRRAARCWHRPRSAPRSRDCAIVAVGALWTCATCRGSSPRRP